LNDKVLSPACARAAPVSNNKDKVSKEGTRMFFMESSCKQKRTSHSSTDRANPPQRQRSGFSPCIPHPCMLEWHSNKFFAPGLRHRTRKIAPKQGKEGL
jgi:hypothetical protein